MAWKARVTTSDLIFVVPEAFNTENAVRSFAEKAGREGVWVEEWSPYTPHYFFPMFVPADKITHIEIFEQP